jgi:hypothetical protein
VVSPPAAAEGADLLPAGEVDVGVRHPQRAVRCKECGRTVVIGHHGRVGELAAQRLDLHAVR